MPAGTHAVDAELVEGLEIRLDAGPPGGIGAEHLARRRHTFNQRRTRTTGGRCSIS